MTNIAILHRKAKVFRIKTNVSKFKAFAYLLSKLAGDESDGGNPLLADFILFAQRLEQLDFTYSQSKVTVIGSSEVQNTWPLNLQQS